MRGAAVAAGPPGAGHAGHRPEARDRAAEPGAGRGRRRGAGVRPVDAAQPCRAAAAAGTRRDGALCRPPQGRPGAAACRAAGLHRLRPAGVHQPADGPAAARALSRLGAGRCLWRQPHARGRCAGRRAWAWRGRAPAAAPAGRGHQLQRLWRRGRRPAHRAAAAVRQRLSRHAHPLELLRDRRHRPRARRAAPRRPAAGAGAADPCRRPGARWVRLPDAPWSRRVIGGLANELASSAPQQAHAVLKADRRGGFVVSLRAPQDARGGRRVLPPLRRRRARRRGGHRPSAGGRRWSASSPSCPRRAGVAETALAPGPDAAAQRHMVGSLRARSARS